MGRDADAAAHGDAVHDGDVGLPVRRDMRVHPIFRVEEGRAEAGALVSVLEQEADVPAGAQAALTFARHPRHRRVIL